MNAQPRPFFLNEQLSGQGGNGRRPDIDRKKYDTGKESRKAMILLIEQYVMFFCAATLLLSRDD
jgi:hypothetical protein